MDKTNGKYTISGYSFSNKGDYERALKEKEAISYIVANTNMADMKAVLKVYNRSVEKKSFQTVLGFEFVKNMRKNLINSGIVSEDTIQAVPVPPDRHRVSGRICKYLCQTHQCMFLFPLRSLSHLPCLFTLYSS